MSESGSAFFESWDDRVDTPLAINGSSDSAFFESGDDRVDTPLVINGSSAWRVGILTGFVFLEVETQSNFLFEADVEDLLDLSLCPPRGLVTIDSAMTQQTN
ncbi:hypothetical protein SNE40_020009 [Patella caerulea]|uniref:Uncharacterized protein n=1 Tax=Patella caerulea TaxID=87958 RepID=A0AAN8G1X9_PATCE